MKTVIERLLEEIEEIKKRKIAIIVEGKKDKNALQELGLSKIFILNETGKSLYAKIEEFLETGQKEFVVLTDLDKKGKQLYKILRKKFAEQGIKLSNKLRGLLIKTKISHVEGLATFLERRR